MSDYTNAFYKKTARIMIAVCGLLFSLFSFVYLYVFQRDVLEALHFSLAHGKTTFAPIASALVITLILLLLRREGCVPWRMCRPFWCFVP